MENFRNTQLPQQSPMAQITNSLSRASINAASCDFVRQGATSSESDDPNLDSQGQNQSSQSPQTSDPLLDNQISSPQISDPLLDNQISSPQTSDPLPVNQISPQISNMDSSMLLHVSDSNLPTVVSPQRFSNAPRRYIRTRKNSKAAIDSSSSSSSSNSSSSDVTQQRHLTSVLGVSPAASDYLPDRRIQDSAKSSSQYSDSPLSSHPGSVGSPALSDLSEEPSFECEDASPTLPLRPDTESQMEEDSPGLLSRDAACRRRAMIRVPLSRIRASSSSLMATSFDSRRTRFYIPVSVDHSSVSKNDNGDWANRNDVLSPLEGPQLLETSEPELTRVVRRTSNSIFSSNPESSSTDGGEGCTRISSKLPTPDMTRRHSSFKLPRTSSSKHEKSGPAGELIRNSRDISGLRVSEVQQSASGETVPTESAPMIRPVSARNNGYLNTGLPILCDATPADIPCVSAETVASVVRGEYAEKYSRFLIVDCRFAYEYRGGHIQGACNISTVEQLSSMFMQNPRSGLHTCVIFHCEFSSHRGPALWRALRKWDRKFNESCYPELSYPHIYLLYKGYEAFWNSFPGLCEPQAYVQMTDSRYTQEMREALSMIKKKGCSKTQALQKSPQLVVPLEGESTSTQADKKTPNDQSAMEISNSPDKNSSKPASKIPSSTTTSSKDASKSSSEASDTTGSSSSRRDRSNTAL